MDRKYKDSIKKRSIFISIFTVIIFISLILRLYYLQIHKSEELTWAAIRQRGKEISLSPKRGVIYDRNLIPLTNNQVISTVIVDKRVIEKDNHLYNEIKNNTFLSLAEFKNMMKSNERLLQIPLIEKSKLNNFNNIYLIDIVTRYGKDNILSHVIGYINKSENRGESGIERLYDEFLKNTDKNSFIVEFDKNRSLILDGIYYANQSIEPNSPSAVKLTIDYNIQKIIESILDKEKLNGSIIVAEVETGEILGMASRPNFDQEKIEKYFNSQDMALYNKAVQVGYPPGSIFKIVVLLTALEENPEVLKEAYYCKGYEEVNGLKIKCGKTHGNISLEEGFAKSCNSVFIQIGKELGAEKVINMAKTLGFGAKVNIGLLEEIQGNLPKDKELLGPAIGNISIGQGKIEATPLQITNLMLTIANNGINKPLSIVKGIANKDGMIIKEVIRKEERQIISTESSRVSLNLLREVVNSGTGKYIDLDEIGSCGGKTGSAEAILNRKEAIHGWFSGFYPAYNPKYVITVLVEDAKSGSISATPIFERIIKEINNSNL